METKKIAYIAIGVVVVLGIAGYLGTQMFFKSKGVNYQQNLNGSQTYSNEQGSVTVGSQASMPSGWPTDVPGNYAGAEIAFSGNSNPQDGKAGAIVSYTVKNVSAQTIATYYKDGLAQKGWTLEGNATLGSQIVIGAKKDGRTFGVSITDGGNGTVTVTAGLEL